MTNQEFTRKVDEAVVRVQALDDIDRRKERGLPTILAALEAGLREPTNEAQWDAYVMLASLIEGMRAIGWWMESP